jgi:hypothetical protein
MKPKLSELPEKVAKSKMKKRVRKELLKAEKQLTRDTQFIAGEWYSLYSSLLPLFLANISTGPKSENWKTKQQKRTPPRS